MTSQAGEKTNWSQRTSLAAQEALEGRRTGLRALAPLAGPAIMASVAYMDPGNFATNIQAGAKFGASLLWVVVVANLVAMLFQSLSAKLGIVTGLSLAAQCRQHLPRPVVIAMWIASEFAAMATDLAEFLGGAIGLSLLFGLPLFVSLALTGLITLAILELQTRGFRPLEITIAVLVAVIGGAYLLELLLAPVNWKDVAAGTFLPSLNGPESLMLAVGIVGATVMPHAIYLHSGLPQTRLRAVDDAQRRRMLTWSNREVLIALGLAGLVNMAMIIVAAGVFHDGAHNNVAEIETAYHTLTPLLGGGAAIIFMIALLASGFSSSVVGTMAGQMIMQDFVAMRIPVWVRRAITMVPSFVVVGMGVSATKALVVSQVVLSLVLPVPMIALLWFTGHRDIMGAFVNTRLTQIIAIGGAVVVVVLNVLLLLDAAGISLPWNG